MDLITASLALDVQMFLRLLVAVVLGALVGYERERAGKPAGVRSMAWSASARRSSQSSPSTDLVVQAIQRALPRRL